jgi:hypothetical protein
MIGPRREDCCPACGSDEVLPYAIILGAAETYGYQCLACTITWPVMQTGSMPATIAPLILKGDAQ